MYDCKRKWRWIKTSMENKYKKFTLNSQCGWWGHDSKNIFCPTRVHCSILWRHISYHKATTWLHDSSVGGKTGIFFQPRDLGHWISLNLTLQWGYTSFVHHHGHRRWHNRWSWDGFTRITLGSLRALIAPKSRRPLISLRTGPLGPCGPWGPAGPCLPGGPGLPRLPLTPLGQCAMQAKLLIASLTSFFMSSLLMISLTFDFLFTLLASRLWRICISATEG